MKFSEGPLNNCKKPAVRMLAKYCKENVNTTFGSNLSNIAKDCQVNVCDLTTFVVKEKMIYKKVVEGEEWRIPFLLELVAIRSHDALVDNFDNAELEDIVHFVCTT